MEENIIQKAKKFTETEVALCTAIIELENYKEIAEGLMGALVSIASEDYPDHVSENYWLNQPILCCSEVLAKDTTIAREAIEAARQKGMK